MDTEEAREPERNICVLASDFTNVPTPLNGMEKDISSANGGGGIGYPHVQNEAGLFHTQNLIQNESRT